MKAWLSAAEIAALKLPGLPATRRNVDATAERMGWLFEKRAGRGGLRLYDVASLPEDAQAELRRRRAVASLQGEPGLPAPAPIAAAGALKDWQARRLAARLTIMQAIDRTVQALKLAAPDPQAAAKVGRTGAIAAFLASARAGTLSPDLAAAIPAANARAGADGARTLSRATLYAWFAARDREGDAALAPKLPPRELHPLAGRVLRAWAQPQKPPLAEAVRAANAARPDGAPAIGYDQARRMLRHLPSGEKLKGRLGPREMRTHQAYVARDTSALLAGDVYVGDGHTFDAEVAHPTHGRPFRPEITSFVDVKTRKLVGWSLALAENTLAVADALRHATETSGPCLLIYVDNGSGANNRQWDDPAFGLIARMDALKMNSLPYNAQAKGIIERLHRTVWVPAAKRLPTFMGADMDGEARNRVHKRTRRELKEVGASRLLPSWADFVGLVSAAAAAYNATPHSALPRVTDPATGRLRHLSPNEAWAAAAQAGEAPEPMDLAAATELFRPRERRKCGRGLVQLFGGTYFARALEDLDGEEVLVAYDVHDAGRVWVHRLDGRLIAEATLNGHARGYLPRPMIEQLQERRTAAKLRRLEHRAETARAELGVTVIESVALSTEARAEAEAAIVQLEQRSEERAQRQAERQAGRQALPALTVIDGGKADAAADPDARPHFRDDIEFAAWLAADPARVTAHDRDALRDLLRSQEFRMLIEMRGTVDLAVLRSLAKPASATV